VYWIRNLIVVTIEDGHETLKRLNQDFEEWHGRRGKEVTLARMQRIYTWSKACLNTAVKHYELIAFS